MYEMWKRAPSHRSAAELRADELEQEVKRLRNELKELKQANASDHEEDQAARMIAKIAEAARRGRTWESGAELMRWVSDHDQFLVSPRTVQRRLDTAGVWERTKRGQTRGGVRKTVKNCIQEAGRFNSDVVD
jgi:DNA repair ATPase RecN